MKYTLFMYWLSAKWIFRITLGDEIRYHGKRYIVANGVRSNSWRLHDLDNDDSGWVKRAECRKVLTIKNLCGSYKSGLRFYKTNWLDIWKQSGIQPWMKGCNIW